VGGGRDAGPDVEQILLSTGIMITRIASLLAAVATNLFLAGLFYSALINPVDFKDFIYKTGIMIFMVEFMSLHSSGMFFGAAQKKQKRGRSVMSPGVKITMFAFYSLSVIVFASFTGQWLIALYFVVSLVSKAVYSRSIDAKQRLAPVAAGIAMLLLSVFLVVFGAQLIADWFPFPPEVTSARPAGQSGLFIDTPQTLMAWGVIYFILITVCELMIFRKAVTNAGRSGEKPIMTGVPT
jgi:hypothetical protein